MPEKKGHCGQVSVKIHVDGLLWHAPLSEYPGVVELGPVAHLFLEFVCLL